MAQFFKRDGSDMRGYDAGLNKQSIEKGRTSDVSLPMRRAEYVRRARSSETPGARSCTICAAASTS